MTNRPLSILDVEAEIERVCAECSGIPAQEANSRRAWMLGNAIARLAQANWQITRLERQLTEMKAELEAIALEDYNETRRG